MADVIIIGSGVAGLTAAVYAARKGMKTLVIGEKFGGQIMLAERIENYAGFQGGGGYDLIKIIKEQAAASGAEIRTGLVVKIEKIEAGFRLTLSKGETLECSAIILACGKIPRRLGIPGEDRFMGKGVHICATCDAPFYKDKTVAVVGGGNSAVEAALSLSQLATKVYVVVRANGFRADEVSVQKLGEAKNVELLLNTIPLEIKGEAFVDGLNVADAESDAKRSLAVDGVFVEIGYAVNADIVKELVKLNENNEVITDRDGHTSYPGIFGCGDVTDSTYKQAIIAAGDGAKAALSAYFYINKGAKVVPDWRH